MPTRRPAFIAAKKPRSRRSFAVLGLVLLADAASAAPATPAPASTAPVAPVQVPTRGAIDEPTAVRRAVERAAIRDIVEGDTAAAQATAVELRVWRNPEVGYTREQTFGLGSTGEDYLWINQTLDIGGRRHLRGRAAMLRSGGVADRGEWLKIQLAAEVRLRYHEVLYRRLRIEALATWSQRLGTALSAIAAREKAGDVARYDRRRLERELALARAREEVEATALARAWARLAALADLPPAAPQTVLGTLLPAVRPESVEQYLARGGARPDIRALERAEAATELDSKAAARARVPELTLGAGWKGVQYVGLRNDGFLINAAITLPVLDRGQGPRRRAEAEGQGLRGRAGSPREAPATRPCP
jgi:cobalt-zinc-cadmium efflux system outer membrane protein